MVNRHRSAQHDASSWPARRDGSLTDCHPDYSISSRLHFKKSPCPSRPLNCPFSTRCSCVRTEVVWQCESRKLIIIHGLALIISVTSGLSQSPWPTRRVERLRRSTHISHGRGTRPVTLFRGYGNQLHFMGWVLSFPIGRPPTMSKLWLALAYCTVNNPLSQAPFTPADRQLLIC